MKLKFVLTFVFLFVFAIPTSLVSAQGDLPSGSIIFTSPTSVHAEAYGGATLLHLTVYDCGGEILFAEIEPGPVIDYYYVYYYAAELAYAEVWVWDEELNTGRWISVQRECSENGQIHGSVTIVDDSYSFVFEATGDAFAYLFTAYLCDGDIVGEDHINETSFSRTYPVRLWAVTVLYGTEETEGWFTVWDYGNCSGFPTPTVELVPRYRMVALIDSEAPDWYFGRDERNGTCWIKMPTSEGLPSVERQHAICGYDNGEQIYTNYVADQPPLYDAWVMMDPVTGEIFYPDPLWDSTWFDPDYTTVIGPPIGP